MVVGDFNGDWKLDFAAADLGGGVQTYPGNGDGTLRRAASHGANGAFSPMVGDFNAEGKLDLVVDTTGAGLQISAPVDSVSGKQGKGQHQQSGHRALRVCSANISST